MAAFSHILYIVSGELDFIRFVFFQVNMRERHFCTCTEMMIVVVTDFKMGKEGCESGVRDRKKVPGLTH